MPALTDLLRALGTAFDQISARWYVFGAQAAIVRDTLSMLEQALARSDLLTLLDEVLRRAAR